MRGRPIVDEPGRRPAALADPARDSADGDEWCLASPNSREDVHLRARPDPAAATGRPPVELTP
jgi:hypothetical protein